jgi:hypothetical protein
MNCEELKEMYELYALGLLEADERDEIRLHLTRGCDQCKAGVNGALALNAMLLSMAPEAAPPARLKRRVLASVGVQRGGWGWLGALAAACMLLVALWLSVEERRRTSELADARHTILRISSERDRLQQAFSFLNDPSTVPVSFGKGATAPPRGNVFVHSRLGVLLIALGDPQGRRSPAGRFVPIVG